MKTKLVSMVLMGAAALAWAHGDDDHGGAGHGEAASVATATAAAQDTAPRAEAQTESYELVAVWSGGASPVLTLYLDRWATNAPVEGAKVELESGAFKAQAQSVAPGVYTVPGAVFAKPGRYGLTVSVEAADGADLMETTLVMAAPDGHEAATRQGAGWGRGVWVAGGVLVLVAGGWGLRQVRQRRSAAMKVE